MWPAGVAAPARMAEGAAPLAAPGLMAVAAVLGVRARSLAAARPAARRAVRHRPRADTGPGALAIRSFQMTAVAAGAADIGAAGAAA